MNIHNVQFLLSATQPKHYPPADRPEVAMAGRSNVGKSSLLNLLVGRSKLARVSKQPGRTQQINFFDIDGVLYLVDLPGYGYAVAPEEIRRAWGNMVERYILQRASLKAVILLIDIRRTPSDEEISFCATLQQRQIAPIIAATKCDKFSKTQSLNRKKSIASILQISPEDITLTSSLKNFGHEEIWQRILSATGEI